MMMMTMDNLYSQNEMLATPWQAATYDYKQLSYGREIARSLIRFRLMSIVIHKVMHKIAFLGHLSAHRGSESGLFDSFNAKKNFVADFHRENASFTRKTAN